MKSIYRRKPDEELAKEYNLFKKSHKGQLTAHEFRMYKRKSNEKLIEEYKQFRAATKEKLTVHEIRMYFTLLSEIADRWVKQNEIEEMEL